MDRGNDNKKKKKALPFTLKVSAKYRDSLQILGEPDARNTLYFT